MAEVTSKLQGDLLRGSRARSNVRQGEGDQPVPLRTTLTERLRIAALTLGALALAWPAFGQIKGEAHGVFVQGADSVFRYRGLAGGGGIVWGNQLGVDGEMGLAVDDSDERSGVLMLAAGGSLRLPFDTKTS